MDTDIIIAFNQLTQRIEALEGEVAALKGCLKAQEERLTDLEGGDWGGPLEE